MRVLSVAERVSTRIFAISIPTGFLGHRNARKSGFSCHRNSTYTSHILWRSLSPKFANEVGGTPLQTCCIGRLPLQREACGKGEEACPQKRTRPSSAVGSRVRLGRRGSRCPSKSVAGRRPSGRGRT